jgi:hypothetical protein
MSDLSCDFRESVAWRSGQRRCIDAAGHCCNERLFFTWKLDGGVMVLDSQRPAIGSPISDKDEVSAAKVKVLFTIDNRAVYPLSSLVHRIMSTYIFASHTALLERQRFQRHETASALVRSAAG